MRLIDHPLYKEDIRKTAALNLPWHKLENNSVLISGGTGMIGSFLVDVIAYKNEYESLNCKLIVLGRNPEKAKERFPIYFNRPYFRFIVHDINQPLDKPIDAGIGFVLHLASNTHPKAYALDPIGTITTNILGTKNLLDFSVANEAKRFVLASSNEIYGENRGDTELFAEDYCGYIDCNTMRAGYPESKRCSEALCQAYIAQKNVDAVIARLTRSYGPSLLSDDTKAMSQFLRNGLNKENIVLKSSGTQFYSYTYAADAVSGLLTVMLEGMSGQAYNIADQKSDITLKELAGTIARLAGTKVVFDLPEATEAAGFSKATKARLDSSKIKALGWQAQFDIDNGIERTLKIMHDINPAER